MNEAFPLAKRLVIADDLVSLLQMSHDASAKSGWWTDPKTGESLIGKKNVGEMLMLIVSEISEAFPDGPDDKLPHHPGTLVELADTVIRCGDLGFGMDIDIRPAVFAVLIHEHDELHDWMMKLNHGETLLAMMREVANGMEAHRKKNRPDERLKGKAEPDISGLGASLARVIFMACIYAHRVIGKNDNHIRRVILEKLEFNSKRPDHKLENRKNDPDGKLY